MKQRLDYEVLMRQAVLCNGNVLRVPPMSFRSCLISIAVLSIPIVVSARPAIADTYKVTVVAHTQDESFMGIDGKGDFAVNVSNHNNSSTCGGHLGDPCFEVFLLSQSPYFTSTAPVLVGNGSPCTIVLDANFGQTIPEGICNNGHEIFGAATTLGVWDGPDPSDFLWAGTFDGGAFMNADGDAVFIDGHDDELIFAQDLTTAATPEPGSLLLFGTGCLSLLGKLRRSKRDS
jgi:hypothetical protein